MADGLVKDGRQGSKEGGPDSQESETAATEHGEEPSGFLRVRVIPLNHGGLYRTRGAVQLGNVAGVYGGALDPG
jgi:hypothetical protein